MIKFTIKYKINKLQLSWIAVRVLPIMKMNTFLLIDFIDAFDLNSMTMQEILIFSTLYWNVYNVLKRPLKYINLCS